MQAQNKFLTILLIYRSLPLLQITSYLREFFSTDRRWRQRSRVVNNFRIQKFLQPYDFFFLLFYQQKSNFNDESIKKLFLERRSLRTYRKCKVFPRRNLKTLSTPLLKKLFLKINIYTIKFLHAQNLTKS